MFKSPYILTLFFSVVLLSSCVSKKKYADSQSELDRYKTHLEDCQEELEANKNAYALQVSELEDATHKAQARVSSLEAEIKELNEMKTNLLHRLSDLSVISRTSAENLRQTLETLDAQSKYSMKLSERVRVKDSLNLALVTSLKSSLSDINDEDVQIEVREGVVYISLSDKMLYRSGSYVINNNAKNVLSKIAKILKDHQGLNILVEGHTDNVPISTASIKDNWDLSVLRATSVVRMLQNDYGVAPERMTAGGRSEYVPKASNDTSQGKSLNRRTEIILLPDLDQFFSLISEGSK